MTRRFRQLVADTRGAAMLEFVLLAPVVLLMVFGIFDLGHIMLTNAMLSGAVEKAGRDSTLEAANATAIDAQVRKQIQLIVPGAEPVFERLSYQDFGNVGKPEPFVDGNANKTRDPGECFQDINANGSWDTSAATSGQGAASQVAVYRVSVSYPHAFPMGNFISMVTGEPQNRDNVTLTSATMLRNQPYRAGTTPGIICT